MCGFVGAFGLSDREILLKMNDSIKHRGPDGEGIFIDKNYMAAHRRLAIIDLSENGHQPMVYNNLVIVFNGEVYNFEDIKKELIKNNYSFVSSTDTEVILKAYHFWGESCLDKFNGMFSFAIWNQETETLFCARDRVGIKPFYYYYDKEKKLLLFASEIKAILSSQLKEWIPNDEIIKEYLYYGLLDHREETFFKDIKRLKAGHKLNISLEGININEYWSPEQFNKTVNEEESVEKFKDLLSDSVRLNLISDVSVGTSLSGGLDSTTIASVINTLNGIDSNQETFSYTSQYKEFDESNYIKDFTNSYDIKHHEIKKTADDFWENLKRLVFYQEEPFISTGMFAGYSVMEKAHNQNVKVMLNGQGADEILGGYRKYRIFYIKDMLKKYKFINFSSALFALKDQSGKSYNRKDDFKKIANMFLRKNTSNIENYLNDEMFKNMKTPIVSPTSFQEMLVCDIKHTSLPALLRYEDKNSMAWSIEARVPFLDHRLIQYCLQLPIEMKMNGSWSKWILRESMKDMLPASIIKRRDKMGFVTEQSIWLAHNKSKIRAIFEDEDFKSKKYINNEKVLEDFDDLLDPKKGNNIWRMINLELWLREFF